MVKVTLSPSQAIASTFAFGTPSATVTPGTTFSVAPSNGINASLNLLTGKVGGNTGFFIVGPANSADGQSQFHPDLLVQTA